MATTSKTAAPATPAEGYRLQYQVATKLGAVPPAGFKIGATTKQMQNILGLTGPAGGFVPKEGLRSTPAAFRYADFLNPGVECEVGLRLGQDVPHGAHTRESVAAAVAEVFPAIEIVEKRYGDLAELGTPSLIADQVFHAAGVLGAPTPNWSALDLGATPAAVMQWPRKSSSETAKTHFSRLRARPLAARMANNVRRWVQCSSLDLLKTPSSSRKEKTNSSFVANDSRFSYELCPIFQAVYDL